MHEPQSGLDYRIMSLGFKVRDLVRPRGRILKDVGLRPGDSVLDFGCGPGGYIAATARLVGTTGKVYALDVNPLAIGSVRKLAARKKLDNVKTILSDGPTGLTDATMDAVLMYDVLHHLENLETVLAEIHRVLKPDGILSVTDHHLTEEDISSRVAASGLFRLLPDDKRVCNFARV